LSRKEGGIERWRTPWRQHRGVDEMPRRNGRGIELLADPTRRRMIALLALRPWRPSILATELGLGRPATTRQLKLLQEAGLIGSVRSLADGRVVLYRVDPRQHGSITAWLAGTEIARRVTRPDRRPIGRRLPIDIE